MKCTTFSFTAAATEVAAVVVVTSNEDNGDEDEDEDENEGIDADAERQQAFATSSEVSAKAVQDISDEEGEKEVALAMPANDEDAIMSTRNLSRGIK